MEEYFLVPNHHIESGWNPLDNSLEFFVLEYCEEVLTVPLYVIKDASVIEEGLELELQNLENWMIGEDWYINLFRMSSYAMAS